MKRQRYHFTVITTHPTLNDTLVSRLAESEEHARESLQRLAREQAPDATLEPATVRRCLEDKPHLID